MLKINSELSSRFAVMSLVCAVLVVTIHAAVGPVVESWQWWVMRILGGLNKIAVPFFFLAAGFFLAQRADERGWYGRALRTRLMSLLVPFYVWLLIWIVFTWFLQSAATALHVSFRGVPLVLNADLIVYLLGAHPFRLVPIFWFLRSLFLLVVLSPILISVRRDVFLIFLGILFGVYAAHEMISYASSDWYNFFEYFLSLRGLFYFSLGVFISRFPIRQIDNWKVKLIASVGVVLLLLSIRCDCSWMCGALTCAFIPCLLIATWHVLGWLPCREKISLFARTYSMPIYLIHFFLLTLFVAAGKVLSVTNWLTTSILAFFVEVIVAVSGSIFIAKAMSFSVSLSSILFGGRHVRKS